MVGNKGKDKGKGNFGSISGFPCYCFIDADETETSGLGSFEQAVQAGTRRGQWHATSVGRRIGGLLAEQEEGTPARCSFPRRSSPQLEA